MLKPMCGMLKASLLCCKQFVSDAESIGYAVNSCDLCVSNKTINNKQHALAWHVDDVKSAHAELKANDSFAAWAEEKCGSEELGLMTATRGNDMII